jgi:hypothetical protein
MPTQADGDATESSRSPGSSDRGRHPYKHWRALAPYGARARRNCYTICRPQYCAGLLPPHTRPRCCRGCRDRGCLTGDHLTIDVLRYPGFEKPPRAILMASNSSVLPSLFVLFGSQPRQPSCHCSGLEPHCRTSRCARPQPTPSPRYCSLIPLRILRVLLAAAPDHCGPPGPAVSPVAVLQQHWLRNSTTAPSCELQLRYCCPAVHVCRALLSFWATRETITMPLTNVYSDKDRFLGAGSAVTAATRARGGARHYRARRPVA